MLLLVFKYAGLFQFTLFKMKLIEQSDIINIILPVGISFYTFQAIGYLLDVYRGHIEPEQHFGKFALFKAFFPQLVAGPIERAKHLLPQLNNLSSKPGIDSITFGARLILFGMFKKVVIADNLAIFVNEVFNQPESYGGYQLALATFFFGFQILCDFSAYTDIAIGSARILGITLIQNFNRPYLAVSVSDFWKRWHISLSTWFRDYLFLPLAWKISNNLPVRANNIFFSNMLVYALTILITFSLTGLWHGANYTFVVWGVLHGLALIFEYSTKKIRKKMLKFAGLRQKSMINQVFSVAMTFSFISFCWIFFRANSLKDAKVIITRIFSKWTDFSLPDLTKPEYFYGGSLALILFVVLSFVMKQNTFDKYLTDKPLIVRWGVYYILLAMIFFAGYFGNLEFIYFQF